MSSTCFVHILQSINLQGYQYIQTHQNTYIMHDLTKHITKSNVQEPKKCGI